MTSLQITEETVELMTDDQLKEFIPKYGDRVAVRSFIARKKKKPKKTEKMSLLEKLRLKLKRKHEDDDSNDDDVTPSTSELLSGPLTKNAMKPCRQVEIGLMLYDEKKQNYVQVRSRKGGGVRLIPLSKSDTKVDIITKAKEVFFNGEKNAFGEESKYEIDLMDFQEVILEEGITVRKILDVTKVQKLRFYLALRKKHHVEIPANIAPNSVNPISLNVSENVSETFLTQVQDAMIMGLSGSDINSSNNGPVSTFVSTSLNPDMISATTNVTGSTMDPGSSNFYIRSVPTDGAGSTVIDGYDQSLSMNNVVFEDSLGEVQFLAQEGNYFNYVVDGVEPHAQQSTSEKHPEMVIKLHRGHIFKELREFFSKPMDVCKLNLKVELYLPDGQKEIAEDTGGVMRDALSEFWSSFYDKCTVGHDVKIPLLRHDFTEIDWSAVGNIIVFGWLHHRYFPVKLSKIFMSNCLLGVETFSESKETLVEEFKSFVSQSERQTIQNALNGEFDQDEVIDVLGSHDCKVIPSEENFKRVVREIAHKTLIQEPCFIKDVWHETIKPHMSQMIDQDVFEIYKKLIPSARKVVDSLRFPEDMTSKQQEVSTHPKKFIRSLDDEKLQAFLRFCTGSDVMGVDASLQYHPIYVRFSSLTGIARRPVAHTCGRVLEIPVEYEDLLEFKSEFCEILKSAVWVMEIA